LYIAQQTTIVLDEAYNSKSKRNLDTSIHFKVIIASVSATFLDTCHDMRLFRDIHYIDA